MVQAARIDLHFHLNQYVFLCLPCYSTEVLAMGLCHYLRIQISMETENCRTRLRVEALLDETEGGIDRVDMMNLAKELLRVAYRTLYDVQQGYPTYGNHDARHSWPITCVWPPPTVAQM
jgi:hypothetical protein